MDFVNIWQPHEIVLDYQEQRMCLSQGERCVCMSVAGCLYSAWYTRIQIYVFYYSFTLVFDPMWNLGPKKRLPPQGCRILASLVSRYAGVLSDVAVVAVRLGMWPYRSSVPLASLAISFNFFFFTWYDSRCHPLSSLPSHISDLSIRLVL